MKEKITFSFGKNWQKFLEKISVENLEEAKLSITEFLGLKDLTNKTFLDIGCGSGLFSLAAFKLKAKKIVSFDVDPFSVKCCKYLHKKENYPKNWTIYKGSILDNNFISKLGKFDIVYAWGVLHHTGDMWKAIKNSAKLVNNGGYYYIAIYNKVNRLFGSEFYLKIKKLYNSSSSLMKNLIKIIYIFKFFIENIIILNNPIKKIKNYKSNRGMDWFSDINDWFGGYPYEYATVEEIFKYIKKNFYDFELINIKIAEGLENNWYLFKKKGFK
ncbi:MAG: class I SAM-dependent methyltransferase [Promethearchaeota archaeon]